MGNPPKTVLVVDCGQAPAAALSRIAARAGLQLHTAASTDEAIFSVTHSAPDLLLIHCAAPDSGALDVLQRLADARGPRYVPLLLLIPHGARELCVQALKLGADDVVAAPWDDEELCARITRLVGLRNRMDALLDESSQLQQLAITDGLTQLHNQRFFHDRLMEEFRRAQRYDDPLALVLLDVDHFKEVNDRHGHPAGDEVLKDIADCIRRHVRETDLLARYGGEEFAFILPKTHLPGALTVAERVWRGIQELRSAGGLVCVTASLGVSGYPGRAVLTAEQLLRTADEALYRAKREGRNKICLHQQVSFFSEPPARAN